MGIFFIVEETIVHENIHHSMKPGSWFICLFLTGETGWKPSLTKRLVYL